MYHNTHQNRGNVYALRHQPQPQLRRQNLDIDRFNQAARAFFDGWTPRPSYKAGVPVRMVLAHFDFSARGYLTAHYADPVTRRISVWGLDIRAFLEGRLQPRRLQA